ncbi:DUF6895 family protein [Nocardiopsis sp. L17-MgMaSL7]|uniref:DUF6895 family protein n=1 Tax=Nocardiopsis sp. L17-MgMaSL7 TaxID=1938893 RepID=UPI000D715BC2|nr:hypothetical protein [Nocardiopsis sp. L17-MgMaSL7]PWV48521.1 hypothetical protein BDW27_11073 [Nocardiopsis sp. L17-MgMaSL7]
MSAIADTRSARSVEAPRLDVDAALAWLEANMAWFEPERWERHLPRRTFPGTPVLELLVLLRVLRRGNRGGDADRLAGPALEIGRSITDRPRWLEELRGGGALFPHVLWLVALIEELDSARGLVPSARFAAELAIATGAGNVNGRYRPPASALELGYVLELAGMDADQPSIPSLLAACEPHLDADHCHMSDGDIYGVTHIMFYATDFGARPAGGPDRTRTVLRLLGSCLARSDNDLTAELLACADYLGAGNHPLALHGHARLSAAQRPDGSVASLLYNARVAERATGEPGRAYAFGTCYHPTITAAMAAMAAREGTTCRE